MEPIKFKKEENSTIQEAIIVEEKPITEQKDYTKNLQGRETIDLNEKKSTASENINVDFMNGDFIDNMIKTKTKEAPKDNVDERFKGANNITRNDILKAEEQSKDRYTAADMANFARIIVLVIDVSMSTALRWWSKDTSDHAYSISKEKKDMLEFELALILTKYQKKFSIEFMFLISLVVVYATPVTKAMQRRKEWKSAQAQVVYEETQNGHNPEEIPKTEMEKKVYKKAPNLKRRGGQPGK